MLHRWTAFGVVALSGLFAAQCEDPLPNRPSILPKDASVDQSKACVPSETYPKGPYGLENDETLPNLSFPSHDSSKEGALGSYYDPCAKEPKILVLRIGAAFCGTCKWSAKHTRELTQNPRASWVDVIVSNEDNLPATSEDALAWAATRDEASTAKIPVWADPSHRFRAVDKIVLLLPLFVFVDRQTMRVLSSMPNPEPEDVIWRVDQELAGLDKKPMPKPPSRAARVDGRFPRHMWEMISEMAQPIGAPPPNPSNEYADNAQAIDLGRQFYQDTRFSPGKNVSCVTCHDPAKAFADAQHQSTGVSRGDRNSPTVILSAFARWQFWDGRADSLWAQAMGPFENPKEYGGSRLHVAHTVYDSYKSAYEAVFSKYPLPPLSDTARFPLAGKPSDAAYDAMVEADKIAVSRILVNVGKAIEAFERSLKIGPSALEAYVGGKTDALSDTAKDGLLAFFINGCAQCHYGPTMSDGGFHNIRVPTGRSDGMADMGAQDGMKQLQASLFRRDGAFSDTPSPIPNFARLTADNMRGKFRTPSLRIVADTGPYGHGGELHELQAVAQHYGKRDLPAGDPRTTGDLEPWLSEFDNHGVEHITAFMQSFKFVPAP